MPQFYGRDNHLKDAMFLHFQALFLETQGTLGLFEENQHFECEIVTQKASIVEN